MELSAKDEARLRILREGEPNTWIAFNDDETQVVGRGRTLADAVAEARRNGHGDALCTLIPGDWKPRFL